MKKYLLFALLVFTTITTHAQSPILWGMTPSGGKDNVGNIFNINGDSSDFKNDFTFYNQQSYWPMSNLTLAANGLLYGMTTVGGKYYLGTIFSYNTVTGQQTELYDFGNGKDGKNPYSSLIQASNGLLYGTTGEGGKYNLGTVFSYNISTGIETDLYNFGNGTDGQNPYYGSLLQVNDSLLYGTTYDGGVDSFGIIYSYNILSGIESDVHDFGSGTNGKNPTGSLIMANGGLLYGLTEYGGANDTAFGGDGTLFSFNTTTDSETDLISFEPYIGSNGCYPTGSLIQGVNGLLYGLTQFGGNFSGGNIFSYNILTDTAIDLYDFSQNGNGISPLASLTQVNDSVLYGLTYYGGVNGNGTIFNYNLANNKETVLHSFGTGTDGQSPENSLFQAPDGLLYGMTFNGGVNNRGIIFSYNISTEIEKDEFDFSTRCVGAQPYGSLIRANDGLLYGLTQYGGYNGSGTLFSYNTLTDSEIDVHDFGFGLDGQQPYGSLLQTSDGLLYGMTSEGGSNSSDFSTYGTIFSYNTVTGAETVVHNFGSDTDGNNPIGTLIQASNGLLYGMTQYGGLYSQGTIISYDITTGVEKDVLDLGYPTSGYYPFGSLVQANNGLLYGMCDIGGGPNGGMMFSFNISTGVETDVHDFGYGNDGSAITGSLVQATNGLLYGMSERGGTADSGTIFSYNPNTGAEAVLHSFKKGSDGWVPFGSLIQATDGLLYGMAWKGGTNNHGIIFSYNIETGTETVIHNFTGTDGDSPRADLLQVGTSVATGINPILSNTNHLTLYPNPTTGLVTISSTKNISTITVTNLLGQIILAQPNPPLHFFNGEGPGVRQIDLSPYPAGMYFITVTTGNETETNKIILDK